MNRPKLTEQEARAKVKASGFIIEEPVMVLAIRGYYKDSMGKPGVNDRGVFDDAFFIIAPNYFKSFNANTDPSVYRNRIGTITPGLHYFKKGKHGISKPGGGYPAFRPDTPDESLPGYRDGYDDLQKIYNTNIHSGGENTTGSEGCQTVIKSQWLEFQRKLYELMDKEGQRRLPYLLIEA